MDDAPDDDVLVDVRPQVRARVDVVEFERQLADVVVVVVQAGVQQHRRALKVQFVT